MDLKELGFSIVAKFNDRSKELFFIYIEHIIFKGYYSSKKQNEVHLSISQFNIDNNYYKLSKYQKLL